MCGIEWIEYTNTNVSKHLELLSFDALQIVRIKIYQLIFNVDENRCLKSFYLYIFSMNFDAKKNHVQFEVAVWVINLWPYQHLHRFKCIQQNCRHYLSNKKHVYQLSSIYFYWNWIAKPFGDLIIKYLTKMQSEKH